MGTLILWGEVPFGDASGYGCGSYGYGDASGSGDGDSTYWMACIPDFVARMPRQCQDRYTELQNEGVQFAYWRSYQNGRPANGGRGVVGAVGAVHEERGPLNLCAPGTLHATRIPPKWNGPRVWLVALHGEVEGDDEKLGCLKREIIGECL